MNFRLHVLYRWVIIISVLFVIGCTNDFTNGGVGDYADSLGTDVDADADMNADDNVGEDDINTDDDRRGNRLGEEHNDNDIVDEIDIDSDDDGLIDIFTLEQLNNIRYNLAGTAYETTLTTNPIIAGAPHGPTDHCTTSTTDGVYLCGYELMNDLDFGIDGSGWNPIGSEDGAFNGIFEGNGYAITNLAMRNTRKSIGFFGAIGTKAQIRNIGLVSVLAEHIGTTDQQIMVGTLVGTQIGGLILGSYATGHVNGNGRGNDHAGGLVGMQADGTIAASYAAVDVDGGSGTFDNVGGLVGTIDNGTIIASFATGTTDGGAGDSDAVGGVAGYQSGGTIIASFATGAIDGIDDEYDSLGGLVGYQEGGSIIAAYTESDIDGDTDDEVGSLIGFQDAGDILISYGLGDITGDDSYGVSVGLPADVRSLAGLSADNTGACREDSTLTTEEACADADNTWIDWGNLLGAMHVWDLDNGDDTPALRFADYDGTGGIDYCALFRPALPADTTFMCGENGTHILGQ